MKARKKVLRYFAGFMAVCMLILPTSVGANIDKEIVVAGDIDNQKVQQIINAISGDSNGFIGIAPSSIACIFGHSMAQTTATETTHRVWATSPRCRRITYRVDYCTRSSCSHIVYTQIWSRCSSLLLNTFLLNEVNLKSLDVFNVEAFCCENAQNTALFFDIYHKFLRFIENFCKFLTLMQYYSVREDRKIILSRYVRKNIPQ
jgi:hypothetical protein